MSPGTMPAAVIVRLRSSWPNYNPFRFAARIDGAGGDASGSDAEPVTELTWNYENPAETNIDIEFDVTSFRGSDDRSADPFGETFEVYIDAPMLTVDESRLAECNLTPDKLKADPEVEGRFVYTVDASREEERKFGVADALIPDTTPAAAGSPAPSQSGERKRLPFKTNCGERRRHHPFVERGESRLLFGRPSVWRTSRSRGGSPTIRAPGRFPCRAMRSCRSYSRERGAASGR